MKIILGIETCNGCKFFADSDCKASTIPCPMDQAIEISDTQLDEIGLDYINHHSNMHLSKYLHALISLTGEGKQ